MAGTVISAAAVSELRQETGVGMMDCKKALMEAGGDKEKALETLRKKGMAAAEKRAARTANEGIVVIKTNEQNSVASLVEINSETDFVARNEEFQQFGAKVADLVLNWKDAGGKSIDDLKALDMGGKTVDATLTELVGKIGEKLQVNRFARIDAGNGYVGTYVHSDTKLGVLVELNVPGDDDKVKTLARDLAMQTAAAKPMVVNRAEMSKEKLDAELEIEKERARGEGKPEPAIQKIAEGRINKWLSSVVLMEQPFVKEQKIKISDVIAEVSKGTGKDIKVKSFVRIRVGE
ncbi:translation elongation factor Ts [bacterium]|nr:translation elongation factor Ts [bacterium]MBU1637982.1 translation elongation factor Ts [bacterium]MBU1920910.1 translation elongation factor Ts [bacterium]